MGWGGEMDCRPVLVPVRVQERIRRSEERIYKFPKVLTGGEICDIIEENPGRKGGKAGGKK